MQFLVGIDLRARSDGALRTAVWMQTTARAQGLDVHLDGVHVVERDKLRSVRDPQQLESIQSSAREALDRVVTAAGAEGRFDQLDLQFDEVAESTLAEKCESSPRLDALLIGRKAQIGTDPVVRLGRVARRMLRALPTTVIVCPPDLDPTSLGEGPVIVATDLSEDSSHAVVWAKRAATLLGRSVLIVHVVPMPDTWEDYYGSVSQLDLAAKAMQADAERALERWASAHGLDGAQALVSQGFVPHQIRQIASENRSPLIVVGSRKLGALARFFVGSVGSELASSSVVPVALVPPIGS